MTYPMAISPGLGVTAAEIQDFDERWMSDAQRQHHLSVAENHLSGEWAPGPWFVGGELMAAMVRMYDLTGRQGYIDHLYDSLERQIKVLASQNGDRTIEDDVYLARKRQLRSENRGAGAISQTRTSCRPRP